MNQLPHSQWQPILNDEGKQVGWNTGSDEIKFSTPERFLQAEGMMQLALQTKLNQAKAAKRADKKSRKGKKGKVAPKQRRGQG